MEAKGFKAARPLISLAITRDDPEDVGESQQKLVVQVTWQEPQVSRPLGLQIWGF